MDALTHRRGVLAGSIAKSAQNVICSINLQRIGSESPSLAADSQLRIHEIVNLLKVVSSLFASVGLLPTRIVRMSSRIHRETLCIRQRKFCPIVCAGGTVLIYQMMNWLAATPMLGRPSFDCEVDSRGPWRNVRAFRCR